MRIATLAVLGGLLVGGSLGQEYRGTFSGIVSDPQGAAIPRAVVVATETRTGSKTTAVCEETGAYSIPFLAPGEYELSAEAPGFKRAVRKGLTLSAGEKPVIDNHLEVGAVSESVTVNAAAPMIVSSTAALGQVVTTKEVEDIPINGAVTSNDDDVGDGGDPDQPTRAHSAFRPTRRRSAGGGGCRQ